MEESLFCLLRMHCASVPDDNSQSNPFANFLGEVASIMKYILYIYTMYAI